MYDESQPEPSVEPDTLNHTKFYGSEVGNDRRLDETESRSEHYRRLANLNRGIWVGEWADKTALRNADNLAIFDSIAGQLELSPHQKRIGRLQFGELNLRELSSPNGIDAKLVAIITCAIVCREDGRFYHPSRAAKNNDWLFVDLLDSFDYRDSVIHSCYRKVLNRVSL